MWLYLHYLKKIFARSRKMGEGPVRLALKERDFTVLMELEKERLRFERDRLVFISVADLAAFWYCAYKSMLSQRETELGYFMNHFVQRLSCAAELGYMISESAAQRSWTSTCCFAQNFMIELVRKIVELYKRKRKRSLCASSTDVYLASVKNL